MQEANILLNQLLRDIKDIKIKLRTLGTLLSVYAASNDWLSALQTVNIMNDHLDKDPSLEINDNKNNILNFYNNIGQYQLAKNMAIDLLSKDISPRRRCITSTMLLNSKINISINSLSIIDFKNATRFCTQAHEPIIQQMINWHFADYYLALNNPQRAIEILESNIFDVETNQYQALIAGFYDLLARSHLALESYSEAERYAQKLFDTEEQHQYQTAITNASRVLAEVNEYKNNYEQAFFYYKKYSEANKIELDQKSAKLLSIQKVKLNVIEKNTLIALLDKENSLLKTQALLDDESAHNRRLVLALLMMALVIFILWAYKNRKTYLEMRYFAQTDELTGIANRHYFAQLAISAIKLCEKTDQPVSFVIFDLDYFKKINDAHGHLIGDEALKMAVNAAKSACRKNDTVGRLGGEEFGILLPGCGNHLAAHIAEKCRSAIEKVDSLSSGHQFTLTASFGVSDSSVCGYEFTKLFAGADRALYQAKDLGRNKVFNYQSNSYIFDGGSVDLVN